MQFRTIFLSILALIAFAGNSVLCRLALSEPSIDPASFTLVRLLAGIIALWLVLLLKKLNSPIEQAQSKGSWWSALMLFAYAILFSYAYLSIDTATGALVLFGMVQLTLIVISLVKGTKLSLGEYAGVSLALAGFVYLVFPELEHFRCCWC